MSAPARLIGFAAKHLASSLSKGGALHPKFHQPVLKMAQRMRIDIADEKKAIETIGAAGVGLVYEHKYSTRNQSNQAWISNYQPRERRCAWMELWSRRLTLKNMNEGS